jgi:hypothetical protein
MIRDWVAVAQLNGVTLYQSKEYPRLKMRKERGKRTTYCVDGIEDGKGDARRYHTEDAAFQKMLVTQDRKTFDLTKVELPK